MNKSIHVFFSGEVQGVWFRATSKEFAAEVGNVTGWIRNLEDGRVEMYAEGTETELENLLDLQGNKFGITGAEITEGEAKGEFSSFEIVGED